MIYIFCNEYSVLVILLVFVDWYLVEYKNNCKKLVYEFKRILIVFVCM